MLTLSQEYKHSCQNNINGFFVLQTIFTICHNEWVTVCEKDVSKINARKWLSAQLMPHKTLVIDWRRPGYLQQHGAEWNILEFEKIRNKPKAHGQRYQSWKSKT